MCQGDVRKHPDFVAQNGFWTEISRFHPDVSRGHFHLSSSSRLLLLLLLLLPGGGAVSGKAVVISGSLVAARRPQAGEALGSDRGYFHGSHLLFYVSAVVVGLDGAACIISSAQVPALLRAVTAAIGACRGRQQR